MSTNILRPIAEIQVSAFQQFDARLQCVAGYRKKGPEELKVSWFHEVFKERYLGIVQEMSEATSKLENKKLENWLIEKDVPARTIVLYQLNEGVRDPLVISELDPDNIGAHIISLAHYFELLNRHPNGEYLPGEEGGLRVNHYDNLAYCRGWNGEVNSVTSDFFSPGWQVKSDPIDKPAEDEMLAVNKLGSWRAGDYVLSYKH